MSLETYLSLISQVFFGIFMTLLFLAIFTVATFYMWKGVEGMIKNRERIVQRIKKIRSRNVKHDHPVVVQKKVSVQR